MRRNRGRRGIFVHLCALGMLAALIVVPEPSRVSAATGWTQVPSASVPAPPSNIRLAQVTCRTPTSCLTVGRYEDSDSPVLPLVGKRTATGWSFRTIPMPEGGLRGRSGELTGLACATATKCFAVGYYYDPPSDYHKALIVRWDGKRWARVTAPEPGTRSDLSGISCPTSTRCFAVGSAANGDVRRTLVIRWNGTGWGLIPSPTPHPRGGLVDQLYAVACTAANRCLTVGSSGENPFSMRWDGSTWTVVPTPKPAGRGVSASLVSIACASSTVCFATGRYDSTFGRPTALLERWNGSKWTIVKSLPPADHRESGLTGVSCPNAKACFVIGAVLSSSGYVAKFGRWSGKAWSFAPASNSPTEVQTGISCSSTTSCLGVGWNLMERWNGTTWKVAMTNGASTGGLSGVSCASPTMCVAVGTAFNLSSFATPRGLVEHWNGTRFNRVSVPRPAGATRFALARVACPATNACFAVGSSDDGSGIRPLVERWDGSSWTVASVPAPAGPGDFADISCPDTTTCFAIGTSGGFGIGPPFVARWDGSTWTLTPAPNGDYLRAISCSSANACLAVGRFGQPSRWNGATWTSIALPDIPGEPTEHLYDVSCLSVTFCMAAGYQWTKDFDRALVARWNGGAWTVMTSPSVSGLPYSRLLGVTCRSTTQCSAVGTSTDDYPDADARHTRTRVQEWNGSTWSIAPSANPAIAGFPQTPRFDSLTDASCASTTCIAVGTNRNEATSFTLAERSP